MGELIINLAITVLAIIGGLYALGLIIVAIIGPPTTNDEYLDDCDCKTCSCDMYPLDLCSSECDADCAANEHYPGQDWRR
jgi:hypothetical protein